MSAADRFDEMFSGVSLAEEFGADPDPDDVPDSVSAKIMVALEFLNDLQDKGLCGDYGCVSWSEKDGLSVMFPQVKVIHPEDAV